MRTPIGYTVRLAIVKKVYRTQIECLYTDREGERTIRCPIPHPYAGSGGGGIFVGFEKNTRVLIAMGPQEQGYIVGVIPDRDYYFSQEGVSNSPVGATPYPNIEDGEICVKGPTGARLDFLGNGNVSIDAHAGNLEADFELSGFSRGLFLRTDNSYKFTEAGREVEGIIKRDKNDSEDPNDTKTINFLSGESYDYITDDVGRSPKSKINLRSTNISTPSIRNPPLVEKRNITYEYANSFGVRGLTYESKAMIRVDENDLNTNFNDICIDPASRENRRTDILDLNTRNFNHLIEKVEGTVVDIYGNILDINRNIIRIPEVGENDTLDNVTTENNLRRLYAYLRRSVKYHMEINSRKETPDTDLSTINTLNNAIEHSRWSVDVDGEGLTKINIPASSETGNIPVLGRYIISRNNGAGQIEQGQFKDPDKKDVRLLQFGFDGQLITDSDYCPESINGDGIFATGTAHHNLYNIASSIFSSGKLKSPDLSTSTVAPISDNINNKINPIQNGEYQINPDANAGGRSINANLDGSAEISIGADTVDRKSLVVDLAGGAISHFGRDRNGRSIIHQTDGDIIIQVGGKGIDTDERFNSSTDTADRPGRVEIHLNRPGGTSQKIIIDENGITFDIVGNGIFKTSGDLTLTAGGKLLLDGEIVSAYGSADTDINGKRNVLSPERLIIRDGRII